MELSDKMDELGSQSSGGCPNELPSLNRIREVEGLELGLLDGEVWDRKISRNSWQGEFEEQSDAPARTISAARLSFQASPGQCEVRNQ